MNLDPITLAAILGMAAVTYACRLTGLLIADRMAFTGRAKAAVDAIPPAVLTAVIAPTLLATGWPETVAGLVTIVAATRLSLIGTIAVGVAAIVVLRLAAGA
ncbi:Branched-chain amino acid transport protein (AzlD) [bacterium YEK0313]|nr:Branched-chain amino acid transport protein (AzlD) [bacterium YEK0313]